MTTPSPDTKETILDAAEVLLAEQGYAGTSIRSVTARAGVNIAAIHYHFGGKAELAKAVFARRIGPMNAERMRRLDAAEAQAGNGTPPLQAVLAAFLGPAIELTLVPESGEALRRLMGRIYAERPEFLRDLMMEQFADVVSRFTTAMAQNLPHLSMVDLIWRFHFVVGSMAHTFCYVDDIAHMSGGVCDPDDTGTMTANLVAFATAGLSAPAVHPDVPR